MNAPETFTIHDLERLTGFAARSIHHYVSRGLLTGPDGSGKAAHYGKEHLLRLQLIQQAKRGGFRIDKRLQAALDGLSVAEMEHMVQLAESPSSEDVQVFGQWLLTGEWRPDPPEVRGTALQARMPATSEMVFESAAHQVPPEEEGARTFRDMTRVRKHFEPEEWARYRVDDTVEIAWKKRSRDPDFERKISYLMRYATELFDDTED
jgi:DNA-binding transcriptional MerR regulator